MTTSTPQNHIESFIEKIDMTIAEFKEVVKSLISGNIDDVEEKIDGQNLTFTVRNGLIETFSKGPTWKRISSGGKTKSDIELIYSDRKNVKEALLLAHNCLQFLYDSHPEVCDKLFQNGKVVISSELVVERSKNLISYEESCIYFVGPFAMDPLLLGEYDIDAYKEFVSFALKSQTDVCFKMIPKVKLFSFGKSDADCLLKKFDDVILTSGANPDGNLGDIFVGLTKNLLLKEGMNEDVVLKVAKRLAKKDKKAFSHNEAKAVSIDFWNKIQKLEESKFLEQALIPFENVLIELSQKVLKNISLENSSESLQCLHNFVSNVRNAYEENKISATEKDLKEIEVLLLRIGDEKRLETPTEGIVFKWRGDLLKLTGLFSSINKLHGLFTYGKIPASIL